MAKRKRRITDDEYTAVALLYFDVMREYRARIANAEKAPGCDTAARERIRDAYKAKLDALEIMLNLANGVYKRVAE